MKTRCCAAALALVVSGCGGSAHRDAPSEPPAPPEGAVAVAAGFVIAREGVEGVVRARGASPREAVRALAFDARAARIAERGGISEGPRARSELRARLARALLEDLKTRADEGAPRADEIARVRKDHWMELDRPRGRRTAHVVVLADERSGEQRARAKAYAEQVYERVREATNEASFQRAAEGIPKEAGLEATFESLPAVSEDARVVVPPGGSFDPAFAAAVFRIGKVGEVSPPFATSFGWHVAIVLEELPAQHPPDADVLAVATPEIRANRASDALRAILDAQKKETPPEIPRNLDGVLRAVDTLATGGRP